MDVFTMVVLIVALGTITGLISNWLKLRSKVLDQRAEEFDNTSKRRLVDLEERVKVLERIATDKRSRLNDEIDAL